MSKASEWAAAERLAQEMHLAWVRDLPTTDGTGIRLTLGRNGNGPTAVIKCRGEKIEVAQDVALALARWLLDTFEDAP